MKESKKKVKYILFKSSLRNEVDRFTTYLEQFENKPVNLLGSFNIPILNVLWTFSAGEVFEYDDTKLKYIIERMDALFREAFKTEKPKTIKNFGPHQ